ncbi:MAG: HypC/HybG/HupF family hydrogenase formation chaperone [Nitrososphaerota archaeon]|jgi:hydrogenase expression/formation protein HypC
MCLGIPVKIIDVKYPEAIVEIGGLKKNIRIDLIENVKPGDYIILHAGFAIQKIDEKEALETLKILEEVLKRNE